MPAFSPTWAPAAGRYAVVAAGVLPALPALLCGSDAEAQYNACLVAHNVGAPGGEARHSEALVAAGVVPGLAGLLSSTDARAPPLAAEALRRVARGGGAAAAAAILQPPVARALVQALGSSRANVRVPAAASLASLLPADAGPADERVAAVAAAGAITGLVRCCQLASDGSDDPLSAVLALHLLCRSSPAHARAAGAAGAAQVLQRLQTRAGIPADVRDLIAGTALGVLEARAGDSPPSSQPAQPTAGQPPGAAAARRLPPAPRVCAAPGCGATSGLRRCGGCAAVRYCSEACSHAHWRAHRAECRRQQSERAAAAQQ